MPYVYYLIYKPFGVLSQFTREVPEHRVLGDLHNFPSDVYPIGRLDRDSEGLLLLTNNRKLTEALLNPSKAHVRTYLVQVEGIPTPESITKLETGVDIRIKKKVHRTRPAKACLLKSPPPLPDRNPPIRFRKNVPDSWLELTLTEGKNRQVRRMSAAVGHPVLRLVRKSIEGIEIDGMKAGEVREWSEKDFFQALKLKL